MIRVVLDTNVIVSALLQPLGPSAYLLVQALNGSLQICLTGAIFAEYDEVISRPRLKRDPEIIAASLHAIRNAALWVRVMRTITVCPDPDDNIFLECAEAAEAEYLVTGNVRHFPTAWATCQIVKPRVLLDLLTAANKD